MRGIETGKSGVATTTVTSSNTARAVGSGNLPVFATPMMVALMEEAACNCIGDYLEAGESSVGIQVNVAHTSASSIGANITATATVTAIDRRKISFDITAHENDGDKIIGTGTHERYVIDIQKFMDKL